MRLPPVLQVCTFVATLVLAIQPARADEKPGSTSPKGPLVGLRQWLSMPSPSRPELGDQPFAAVPLTKVQAHEAKQLLIADHAAQMHTTRQKEWTAQLITLKDQTLRWKQRQFGVKPKGGWNLFISLHGGGGTATAVNDEQWENQIKLYQPKDSLYIAPRAPTDHWNLWHEPQVDMLLDRLLEDAFVLGEVNPNRVYIMGYSAGGDGVYQLAPRMADRWAAAAMMAGHPNDASPLGLRNIGFTIHVGALDAAYNRNEVAADWGKKLDALHDADPAGYAHLVELHAGRGHWMNLEDKSALDWMGRFTRNPIPEKVVWQQSSVTHSSFYWLVVPSTDVKGGQLLIATRKRQEIDIEKSEGVKSLTLRVSDAMLDLDQAVTVTARGAVIFRGVVPRTVAAIHSTLRERGDPLGTFEASVTVQLDARGR